MKKSDLDKLKVLENNIDLLDYSGLKHLIVDILWDPNGVAYQLDRSGTKYRSAKCKNADDHKTTPFGPWIDLKEDH